MNPQLNPQPAFVDEDTLCSTAVCARQRRPEYLGNYSEINCGHFAMEALEVADFIASSDAMTPLSPGSASTPR